MPTLADIKREKARYEENFEPNHNTPWGVIVEVDGSTSPPNRSNMTWVDMYNRSNGRLAVINDTTIKTAGTPVQLGPAPKPPYLAVVGTYNDSLHPTDSTTNLGQFNTSPHAPNHQYVSESDIGADVVKVYQPALQPLKITNSTGLVFAAWCNGNQAKLYTGQWDASLELKSTLLFPAAINPFSMVYNFYDDSLYAAAARGNSLMVIKANSPFTSWKDITYDHSTSNGINAIVAL